MGCLSVAGPKAKELLARVTKESIDDWKFLDAREVSNGKLVVWLVLRFMDESKLCICNESTTPHQIQLLLVSACELESLVHVANHRRL